MHSVSSDLNEWAGNEDVGRKMAYCKKVRADSTQRVEIYFLIYVELDSVTSHRDLRVYTGLFRNYS
jgi:hypothetical protein